MNNSNIKNNAQSSMSEKALIEKIMNGPIPEHLCIIMDGNRRFARLHGISAMQSHRMGADKLEDFVYWCKEIGIRVLTVFAFSTENNSRSAEEINYLMDIFEEYLKKAGDSDKVHDNGIQIQVIGCKEGLPTGLLKAIQLTEERTICHDPSILNIAVNYGGRGEIVRATRMICKEVRDGKISIEDINEELVSSRLYTAGIPDPDLVIRTSGEKRISNFLLWQIANSDLYFADAYWPAFLKIDFLMAIHTYQKRKDRIDPILDDFFHYSLTDSILDIRNNEGYNGSI